MPETNTVDVDLPQGPLESRLSPEQIADLDKMNAKFMVRPPEEPAAPAPPAPPAEPVAPAPPEPPAPPAPAPLVDEFTPPEDDAPAAPEPAPTEEFPESKHIISDEAIDKLRTEQSKKDVRKLGAVYDSAVKQLKAATTEIETLRKQVSSGDNALVAELQKQVADLSAIVEQKSILDHPGFKADFVEPRKILVSRAAQVLEFANIDRPGETLERALGLQGREKITAMDQLYEQIDSPSLRTKLENALDQIDALDDKRAQFLANREGNAARIAAEEKAREVDQRQKQESAVKSMIDETFSHLATKSAFFRRSGKPGHEAWDKSFDAARSIVEEVALRNEDPKKLVAFITLGAFTEKILGAYMKSKGMVAERDKRIAELTGARPSINGDRVPSGEKEPRQHDPNANLLTLAKDVIRDVSGGY